MSIWHRDIFMVTPKQLKGRTGSSTVPHPRSCVCRSCLAQYGTYQYYSRAMRDQRETRTTPRESTRESRSAPRESKSQITRASSSKKHTRQSSMVIMCNWYDVCMPLLNCLIPVIATFYLIQPKLCILKTKNRNQNYNSVKQIKSLT